MDQNFQTSFIPKRPLMEDRVERPKTVSMFLFFATILLIASVIGAAFVYFYKTSLTNQVTQMRSDLQKAESAFEGDFIQQLQVTDKRINAANEVLSNHVTISPVLSALGAATLKSIQFTKFSYAVTGTGPTAQVTVMMSGISQSYTAIALESAQLTGNKYIKNPIFSNLALNQQGQVLFDLTFSVDPQYVLYGQMLARSSGSANTNVSIPASSGAASGQASSGNSQASGGTSSGGVVSFPSNGQ
jgi:hypothetical protein